MIISKRSIFVWITHLQRLHNQMRDIFTAAHLDNLVMSNEKKKKNGENCEAIRRFASFSQYYFFILTKFDSKLSSACEPFTVNVSLFALVMISYSYSFFVALYCWPFVLLICRWKVLYRFNPIFFDGRVVTFTFARSKWTDRIYCIEVHKLQQHKMGFSK